MATPAVRRGLLAAVLALAAVAPRAAAPGSDAARAYLAATLDLSESELARVSRGQVVGGSLPADDPREVATFGVVRVRIPPDFYVARLADIANFKRDEAVLQVGVFGTPPTLDDVRGLTLDDADIRSLRGCRVGDCGVQLSADAIGRFRQELDWQHPDAAAHANDLMRRILVEYVAAYQQEGAAVAMQYADRSDRISLQHEFVSLTESAGGGWRQFPVLRGHLAAYPAAATPNTTDLIYWSKEKVGRRAVASVTHLSIARTAGASPAEYAVASKHIYGTHYFDASLGLTVLLRDPASSEAATFVAYVNRSRIDMFGGMFGGVVRRVVASRARSTVSNSLARLQRTLEREYAGSHRAGYP